MEFLLTDSGGKRHLGPAMSHQGPCFTQYQTTQFPFPVPSPLGPCHTQSCTRSSLLHPRPHQESGARSMTGEGVCRGARADDSMRWRSWRTGRPPALPLVAGNTEGLGHSQRELQPPWPVLSHVVPCENSPVCAGASEPPTSTYSVTVCVERWRMVHSLWGLPWEVGAVGKGSSTLLHLPSAKVKAQLPPQSLVRPHQPQADLPKTRACQGCLCPVPPREQVLPEPLSFPSRLCQQNMVPCIVTQLIYMFSVIFDTILLKMGNTLFSYR